MQLAKDDLRKEIIEYLENEFLGPALSQDHSFKDNKDYKPFNHLIAGMIFPQEAERDEAASENEIAWTMRQPMAEYPHEWNREMHDLRNGSAL